MGSFLPQLTRKAFEKYGFASVGLFAAWPEIAGAALARAATPVRLIRPRGAPGKSGRDGETARGRAQAAGATLVLRTDPARALDVSYGAGQIVARINAYFGYPAVARLRIERDTADGAFRRSRASAAPPSVPAPSAAAKLPLETAFSPHALPGLHRVSCDGLRSALMRLAAHVAQAPAGDGSGKT